jgi:hypothetical protein
MSDIQASGIPIKFSSDSGVTWKTLICLKNYNVPITRSTNESETFCGKSVGLGALSFNPQGNAVVSTTPASDEVTLEQMLIWITGKTELLFRTAYPTASGSLGSIGDEFFVKGSCYIVSVNMVFATNDVVNFDFEARGFGDLDILNP